MSVEYIYNEGMMVQVLSNFIAGTKCRTPGIRASFGMTKKFDSILKIDGVTRNGDLMLSDGCWYNPDWVIPYISIDVKLQKKKEIKEKMNQYKFQGDVNLTHLCKEMIEDGHPTFMITNKTETLIGVLRGWEQSNIIKLQLTMNGDVDDNNQPYHIVRINREHTLKLKNALKKEAKSIRYQKKVMEYMVKEAKEKSANSNKPASTVFVF